MLEELKKQLRDLGLNDEQVGKLETEGAKTAEDLALLSATDIKDLTGCGVIIAKKVAAAFAAKPTIVAAETVSPAGAEPSKAEVNDFAKGMGIDPSMLSLFLFGGIGANAGIDIDLSTMMPIPQIVAGYNPKIKNVPYMIMGQVQRRLTNNEYGIVVINDDGGVNTDLTTKHVMNLEEGFRPPEDNIFYDEAGKPFEIIKVGVDAQSIYDADPLDPTQALQKNGMGIGRINWHNVPLDVRQVVFFATTQTGELDPTSDAKLQWLRSNIGPDTRRLNLRGEFPKALNAWNEASRTGALPTLRVQLSRSARKPEVMPRRRARTLNEGGNAPSGSFRDPNEF